PPAPYARSCARRRPASTPFLPRDGRRPGSTVPDGARRVKASNPFFFLLARYGGRFVTLRGCAVTDTAARSVPCRVRMEDRCPAGVHSSSEMAPDEQPALQAPWRRT